jgi:tyrosine-protein phosphatase SIW14
MRGLCLIASLEILFILTPVGGRAHSSAQVVAANSNAKFGEKLAVPGIPNAGKISGELYRGAQPHAEGFAQLKKLGVTTIVDLRAEDAHKREWERKQSAAQDMRFVSISVGDWDAPSDAQVAQFLSLFRRDARQKVFVHCHFGDDRTGVFVAAYRIALDHWSADQAIKEMHYYGFHRFWHPAMESYARSFPERLRSDPILAPFRPDSPSFAGTR